MRCYSLVFILMLNSLIIAQTTKKNTPQKTIKKTPANSVVGFEHKHLLGEWMRTEENGDEVILLLSESGMGSLGANEFSFSIKENKLIVKDYEGNTLTYTYQYDEKGITLLGNEYFIPHKFYKKGSDESYRKRVINQPEHLIGKWKNIETGGNVEFSADSTMTMSGQVYKFVASYEEITFQGSNGNRVVPYNLKGSKLTLDFPEKVLSLKRISANDIEDPMGGRTEKKPDVKRKLPTNSPSPK